MSFLNGGWGTAVPDHPYKITICLDTFPCRERWGTWDTEWLTPAARGQEQFVDRLQLYFVASYLKTKQTLSQQRRRSFLFFVFFRPWLLLDKTSTISRIPCFVFVMDPNRCKDWNKGKLILQTLDHMAFDKRYFWLNQMVRKGNMKLSRHRSCCWPELCISNWKPKLFLFIHCTIKQCVFLESW